MTQRPALLPAAAVTFRRSAIRDLGERLLGPSARGRTTTAPARLDLRVEGVTVAYSNGHVALRDASLTLDGATICGLLGVNGAGKSTLFKAIMGMVTPAAGDVRIGGHTVAEAQRLNWVAYVPQNEEVDGIRAFR